MTCSYYSFGIRARPPVARSIEHECADTFPRGTTSLGSRSKREEPRESHFEAGSITRSSSSEEQGEEMLWKRNEYEDGERISKGRRRTSCPQQSTQPPWIALSHV